MGDIVQVHATFTVPEPLPVFVVAVEVLEGSLSAGMFLRIPLNSTLEVTVRVASIAPINSGWGLPLVGLCLRCDDDGDRQIIDAMSIGDEILAVSVDGDE